MPRLNYLRDNGMLYKDVTHKIKDWMVEMEFYENFYATGNHLTK